MLKTLQKSVEEEEMVWRTQILESEDKRKMVGLYTVKTHTHTHTHRKIVFFDYRKYRLDLVMVLLFKFTWTSCVYG